MARYSNTLMDTSRQAAADLSALQYTGVYIDTNGKAAACSANTDQVFGILYNKPVADEVCEIALGPIVKLKVSAALATPGTALCVGASGKFEAVDNAADKAFAFSVGVSTADGDIIEAMVTRAGKDQD